MSTPRDSSITDLTAVSSLTGAEVVPVDQTSGSETQTKKATVDQINDLVFDALASTDPGEGDARVRGKRTLTSAVAFTLHAYHENRVINVKTDFGAVGDAVADDTLAFQAAIDAAEQEGRVGGVVLVPKGTYLITDTLRIGGFVRLVGEGFFSSSLFFNSSLATGNCIELGPDQSGEFGYSGSYVFGACLEHLDINAGNVDRGATAAVVYTQGAHQPSGIKSVQIRNFLNTGVRYAVGNGGPAQFTLDQVDLQSSTSTPAAGDTIGLWCDAGGAIINLYRCNVQGNSTRAMTKGVRMQKDSLCAVGCHFEYTDIGVSLEQNESAVRTNTLVNLTGHNSIGNMVDVAATNNVHYTLFNVNNTNISGTNTNVLRDNKQGITIGGVGGKNLPNYHYGAGEALKWGFGITAAEGTVHVQGDRVVNAAGNNGTTNRVQEFAASIASSSGAQTKVMEFQIPATTMFAMLEIVMVGSRANASDTVGTSQVAKTYASIARRGSGYDVVLDVFAVPSFEVTSTTAGGTTNKTAMAVTISRSGAEANTAPQNVQITAVPGDSAGTTGRVYCYVRVVSHSVLTRVY